VIIEYLAQLGKAARQTVHLDEALIMVLIRRLSIMKSLIVHSFFNSLLLRTQSKHSYTV